MKRAAPRRLFPALATLISAGALLQAGVWVAFARPDALTAQTGFALAAAAAAAAIVLMSRTFDGLARCAVRLADGKTGPVRSFMTPTVWPGDPALLAVERLQRDLHTQLDDSERLRKQAEEASAYKAEFLRSVRHELRTPLNSVLGFSEVLLSDLEGPLSPGQRENLTVIQRTGKRLQDLFDEVLELSSVASNQLELDVQAIDVQALLERIGESLEEQREDRPVHIRIAPLEGLPPAAGDPQRVRQLLEGIASHALSVAQGAVLELSASVADGGALRISVRDPSRVLAADQLADLTGSKPTAVRRKGLDEGTRLRIALFRQLAQLHRGDFTLESTDEGTVFALQLPAWSEA